MTKNDYIPMMVEEYVRHFNDEMDAKILLSQERCDDFLPYIEISDDGTPLLHFDKSCIVLLAFYFFGSPSLFHKYCVSRKLFDYGYCNEANNMIFTIQNEFASEIDSFIGLLSCNPEWIEMEISIMITHEFGHYLYANSPEFSYNIKNDVLGYLSDYKNLNKTYNPIKVLLNSFNKHMLTRLVKDCKFIEELAADTFAYNHFCEICSYVEDNVKLEYLRDVFYPTIMAAISGTRYFSEYMSIVNRIYFNSPNKNEKRRLSNNFRNQLKKTISDVAKTSYIEQIATSKIKQDGRINKYYRTLIYPRVKMFNHSLNRDLCSYLQRYMTLLKHGANVTCDNDSYEISRACLEEFEDYICDLISLEIIKKKASMIQA